MISLFNKVIKIFVFILFFKTLDLFLWILIQLLPGTYIQYLITRRPTLKMRFSISNKFHIKLSKLVIFFLRKLSKEKVCSTCLSRAITGRLIMDFLNMPNILKLGIIVNEKGDKCPHAWLERPLDKYEYIPGLMDRNKSCLIKSFN